MLMASEIQKALLICISLIKIGRNQGFLLRERQKSINFCLS